MPSPTTFSTMSATPIAGGAETGLGLQGVVTPAVGQLGFTVTGIASGSTAASMTSAVATTNGGAGTAVSICKASVQLVWRRRSVRDLLLQVRQQAGPELDETRTDARTSCRYRNDRLDDLLIDSSGLRCYRWCCRVLNKTTPVQVQRRRH